MIRIRTLLLAAVLAAPSALSAQERITIRSDAPPRGWIGVSWRLDPSYVIRSGQPRTRAAGFPTVSRLEPGSPAALAGLRVGDAIVSLNGVDSRDGPLFTRVDPGTRYLLRIRRGDEEREVTLVVARPPASLASRAAATMTARPKHR
jgi:S1-C subfamily serine protease